MSRKMTAIMGATSVCLLIAGILLYQRYFYKPPTVQQSQNNVAATGPPRTNTWNNVPPEKDNSTDTAYSERSVDPLYELQDLIHDYEQELMQDADRKFGHAVTVAEWTNLRKAGRTRWGSETWMKEPHYYADLDTPALALECFSGSIFGIEMALYNEPSLGLESLRIFHDGFAELLKRDDMWEGILVVYDHLSSQIDPHADLAQIVRTSSQLDELRKLYGLTPLRDQVKGRERLFLAAQVDVLKRYMDYLATYDPKALGTGGSPGFFREPCSVAGVALLLAKQIDARRYAKIETAVTGVRWTEEQKVEDLKRFITLVLDSLGGFPMNRQERE